MYISHKYQFVYLRTPKTASSSMSEFLIKNIPDETAIYTDVEDSETPGTVPQNLIEKYYKFKHYHFTLQELINEGLLTKEQAMTYNCFAVLRNPIDRQKSVFYFEKKFRSPNIPATLELYKKWAPKGYFDAPNWQIKQSDFLTLDNEIVGNYWLYENINDEINNFMKQLGLEIKHPLPVHKTGFRNKANEIEFDEESLNMIKSFFEKDFELYEKLTK